MLSIIENSRIQKFIWKTVENWHTFWQAKLKNWHAKLNNWHIFGTFIGTFARKNEKLARV